MLRRDFSHAVLVAMYRGGFASASGSDLAERWERRFQGTKDRLDQDTTRN